MKKIEKYSYCILYNFLLPFVLVIGSTLRINFISFVYFVFSLFLPLTVSPPISKYPGHPHRFISVVTFWSTFSITCQLIFNFIPWENVFNQTILPSEFIYTTTTTTTISPGYNEDYLHQSEYSNDSIDNETFIDLFNKNDKIIDEFDCHPFVRWLRQMGFDKIRDHWTIPRIGNLFASDVIVFLCGSILLIRLKILKHRQKQKIMNDMSSNIKSESSKSRRISQITAYFKKYEMKNIIQIYNVTFTIACCIIGSFHPTILSLAYFLTFIGIASMWAFDKEIPKHIWSRIRGFILLYSAFHLCLIYIYQLSNVYRNFPQHGIIARIFGLIHYENQICDNMSYPLPYQSFIWPEYLFPFLLYLFYYFLATQITMIREYDELKEIETMFGKTKDKIAGIVVNQNQGSTVSLGYEKKISEPDLHIINDKDKNLKDKHKNDEIKSTTSTMKLSESSTLSLSSKKFPKMTFAEKIAKMKAEKEKMKNLAKWETFKPVIETIKTQSYVIALIVLMAWSLCYHSWSTFVMLILSFVVWMHPDSQGLYIKIAPFIVIYSTLLLLIQYIYSLPLSQDELPDENPTFLRQLGLEKPRLNAPVIDILLKSLFSFVFWLALRQILENQRKSKETKVLSEPIIIKEEENNDDSTSTKMTGKLPVIERIKIHISNFWIFFVLGLLLTISMRNPVVFYRIIYMGFFLIFLSTFTVSFPFFRKILKIFWLTMIGYCIFVVTLIYTYQFHGIPDIYHNYLKMSEDITKSIGLETISSSKLLIRLLTPISFLIFTLIQLNFFHQKMMNITQKWEDDVYGLKLRFLFNKLKLFHRQINYLESGIVIKNDKTDNNHDEIKGINAKQRIKKVMGEIEKKCKLMLSYRQNLFNIIWRLAEIQIDRIVAYLIVYIAVNEVSSLNLPLIICVAISLTIESKITSVFNFVSIFSSIVIILKMLFQMEFIKEENLQVQCLDEDMTNGTIIFDSGKWFGMTKVDSIFNHTKWHLFIVFSLVFRELIRIRQFLHRKQNRLEEPPRGIMFPGITRKHADLDVTHCVLYFSNYFFYKFGVEICFISSVITIGIRNDLFAVFYVIWLIFLLTRTRIEQQQLWCKYTGFLAVCFVFQYILAIGIPGMFCVGYFWDSWDDSLIEWLNLPSFKILPNTNKLFFDFFQLLCVSSQFYVFKLEMKYGTDYPGGSNELVEMRQPFIKKFFNFNLHFLKIKTTKNLKQSTVPDFISDGKTFLDKAKYVFFMYFYWITLSMIFIAGTTHVTLFAAGYVFGCFLFLWMGYSFFFKPTIVVLRMWDLLLFYNVSVILLKTVLQLVGCVYMSQMYKNFCWLLQLLGVACNKVGYTTIELVDPEILAECDIPHQESGIFYDNLCFVFLLIQKRIFGSEYFKHVISELKAQRFFASRGAELIEKINKQEIQIAEEREKEMMDMVDTMVSKISKKHKKPAHADDITTEVPVPPDEGDSTQDQNKAEISTEVVTVNVKDPIMVEIQPSDAFSTPSTLSPMSPDNQTSDDGNKSVVKGLNAPKRFYRPQSLDIPRSAQQQNLDKIHRRKSDNTRLNQKSQDEESDSWSINSNERSSSTKRKTREEGGVKGLGPLQLINFAIKKGAIRDAVKESNEMEKTHTQMEKEMEKNFGTSDYRYIRKRILKQKAREKAKPDFDEETFETDALTNVAAVSTNNEVLMAPPGAKISITSTKHKGSRTSLSTDDVFSEDEEQLSPSGEESELEEEIIIIPLTKKERLKQVYRKIKIQVIEYTKMLFIFIGLLIRGTLESFIQYLMSISRDYRYIAYILQEEKRIHKELFNECLDVDDNLTKKERHVQRAMIREKLQEKYDKSGFLKDEGIRRIHQYVEETEVEEESQAMECPKIEIQHCSDDDDENSDSQKIDGKKLENIEETDEDSKINDKIDDKDTDFAIIQPAVIIQKSDDGSDPKVVHVPAAVLDLETDNKHEFEETLEEMKKEEENEENKDDENDKILEDSTEYKRKKEEYLIVRLIIAVYYAILSRSELICYLMIILNHINSASLLSMPLPFLMLCWGTLTVPVPTKNFWIAVITYTETMVVIKYIFQFGFFPWNHAAPSLDPFWIPRILGIEKRPTYAAWDLALLMTLFLHRNILMSIGLWNKQELDDDDETNSVTSSIAKKDSEASNPPSLAFPHIPKRTFSRRFTSISFSSVAQRLRKEKIKKKVDRKVTRVKGFFGNVLNPFNRVPVDVYAPMFLCDIICFLIVIFGFSSFGTDNGAGSVAAYFEENKVPGTLVAMLIIQFVLIIIDRALFLRKFLLGKLFFQLFLVIFIHIWIFFLLPGATDRLFINNFTCILWYFVKSVYFLISAKQIRCGYPKFSVGNVLTRSYNYFNYILKNAYMKVPFLFEIGLLTDWIWKDTSLNLGDWITLHDIYSNIARLKCVRNWEEDFPSPKGVKQRPFIKYGYGGLLLVLIILIIWFPLVLFSMANTVGLRSTPIECTCRLTIAGYQPLFDSTARMGDITPLTMEEYDELYYTYRMSKTALSYIADYTHLDVVKANINGNSQSVWQISPPSREYMILNLNSSIPMSLQFEWNFKRAPNENLQQGLAEDSHTIELEPGDPIRQKFISMIKGESTTPILIPNLFPSKVKVPGEGKADYASALLVEHLKGSNELIQTTFNDVLLQLVSINGVEYWKIQMIDPMFDPIRKLDPIIHDRLIFYGFVDKVFPKSFSFITGGGILGLYMTIVFLLGQYIRGFVIDSMQSIMFEELPNVDRILDLCHKIFFVRDVGRFDLEEALYANLVFLFRSPATLIKWTKERPP